MVRFIVIFLFLSCCVSAQIPEVTIGQNKVNTIQETTTTIINQKDFKINITIWKTTIIFFSVMALMTLGFIKLFQKIEPILYKVLIK